MAPEPKPVANKLISTKSLIFQRLKKSINDYNPLSQRISSPCSIKGMPQPDATARYHSKQS